jgi:hypothetical protein
MNSKNHPVLISVLIPRTYTNHISRNMLCQTECLLHQVCVSFNDAVSSYDYLATVTDEGMSMEKWNTDKESDTVEQRSNKLEAPGVPGVGLVIGSDLVNPDPVRNSLWTATTDPFYPLGVCVSDIVCCCQLLRFHRVGQW